MAEKEKALIRRAIDTGHITRQCNELEDPCTECKPAEEAWELLKRLVRPKAEKPRVRTLKVSARQVKLIESLRPKKKAP